MSPSSEPESAATKQRVAALEEELAAARLQITTLAREHEKLRAAYQRNLEQLQLLQRRLFMAKAERPVAPEEQLSFDALIAEVARLEKALEAQEKAAETEAQGGHGTKPPVANLTRLPSPAASWKRPTWRSCASRSSTRSSKAWPSGSASTRPLAWPTSVAGNDAW